MATTTGAAPSNVAGLAGPAQVKGGVLDGRVDASAPTGGPWWPAPSVATGGQNPAAPVATKTPLAQFLDGQKNLAPTRPAALTIPATATVSGTVTASGSPVAGACVELLDAGQQRIGRACTEADGHYSIAGIRSGMQVKAKVSAAGFVDQWAPDRPFYRLGTTFTLLATTPTVIDFAVHTGGTIRG